MTKDPTNLTRRKLLASMPAAAAMAPAAATALCRLPSGDDPVFAAIERHRKAFDAYNAAHAAGAKIRKEYEAQRDPRGIYLGEVPEKKWITERIGAQRLDREIPTDRMVPCYAKHPGDIDNYVPTDCTDIEAWKAEKHREWKQWSGFYEGSPISIASDVWNDGHMVLIDATIDLNVKPTTLAGVAALLAYVATFPDNEIWTDVSFHLSDCNDDEEEDEEDGNSELGFLKNILLTIAAAAQSIRT
jgi:hypothetical protein